MKLIILIIGLLISSTCYAATAVVGNATVTLDYVKPLATTEILPFTFSLTRKPNVGIPAGAMYVNDVGWLNYYITRPIDTQVPGCFSIDGQPGYTAKVLLTMPTSLSGASTNIPVNTDAGGRMEGSQSNISCADGLNNGFSQTLLDNSTNVTFPAGAGTLYFRYRFAGQSYFQVKSMTQARYSGTATVTVNYN